MLTLPSLPLVVPFGGGVASNAASKLDPAVLVDFCETVVMALDADLVVPGG